jgi:hypothetical protein
MRLPCARVFETRQFTWKSQTVGAAVVLALTWSVVSSLAVYPHSLSYFNELAAVLPTPADASYPTPNECNDENLGLVSKVRQILTAGPRNGPRHLLDSNIDWGQDLFFLNDWLRAHPDVKLDGLACWGSYPATLAGIPATPQPPSKPAIESQRANGPGFNANDEHATNQFGPKPGWYAVSVNYIYGRDRKYRYFLNRTPVAMAGYSIYIYHVTGED